jgi:hypothetical protein
MASEPESINFGWLERLQKWLDPDKDLRNRVIPVEQEYHPGLDNPVDPDSYCARFQLFKRRHRPDDDFEYCVYCQAPIFRPDREN